MEEDRNAVSKGDVILNMLGRYEQMIPMPQPTVNNKKPIILV